MRPPLDRLRYALSFEIIALLLVVPLGALVFHTPMHAIGVVGVVGSLVATLWNVVYNYLFDLVLKHRFGTTQKPPRLRVVHAVLFELGLLVALLPFVAWYLDISLWQALQMDVALALFYMAFAYVFAWAYDRIFPLPEWSRPEPAE